MAYWLMKSEPETYGIDHLIKEGTGMWEGCRNYQVRNYLRDQMKPGDEAFFYHSSTKDVGIAGTMEVVSEAYPDPTQFDPKSKYFDAKSPKDNPRWFVRDLKFTRKFKRLVPLSEIKAHPVLQGMQVAKKGLMFSITPVTDEEWDAVMSLPGI
jgi:predicted RNA-binding protein with PUA-like domain